MKPQLLYFQMLNKDDAERLFASLGKRREKRMQGLELFSDGTFRIRDFDSIRDLLLTYGPFNDAELPDE